MDSARKLLFTVQVRNCALELARSGSPALAKLFDLTAPRLIRYARLLTHNLDDAEDAVQAAMVRISLHPQALADAWHPWPYFIRVVRNEALKLLRRRRPAALADAGSVPSPVEGSPPIETEESRQRVQAALGHLPPEQAEVVVLKIWEDMTFNEISEILGQSPNTVASRYRYALQKLSPQLQSLCDEMWHV